MTHDAVMQIDGKPVAFRVSNMTGIKYRLIYRRSLDRDIRDIDLVVQTSSRDSNIPVPILRHFGNVAHLMAWEADAKIERVPDRWYEGFDTFNIFDVAPVLISLWKSFKGVDAIGTADRELDSDSGNPKERIARIISGLVTEKYKDVSAQSVTVNNHMGLSEPGHYITLLSVAWKRKRGKKATRETLLRYSSDLAAAVATQCPAVHELVIFWAAPRFDRIKLKHTFERRDGKLVRLQ